MWAWLWACCCQDLHGDSDSADDEDEESMSSSDSSSFHTSHSNPRPMHRVTPLPSDLESMSKGNIEEYFFVVQLHFYVFFLYRFVLCSHCTLFGFPFLDLNLIGGYGFHFCHFMWPWNQNVCEEDWVSFENYRYGQAQNKWNIKATNYEA